MTKPIESTIEFGALAKPKTSSWISDCRPDTLPSTLSTERYDYSEVMSAERLSDTLFPELISGEIRVHHLEKLIREV